MELAFSAWLGPWPQFSPFRRDENRATATFGIGPTGGVLELVQRVKNHLNVFAVEFLVALQFSEFAGEFRRTAGLAAQSHERAEDVDAHLNRAAAAQDIGRHDHAVLGEGAGEVPTTTTPGL